MIPNSHPLVSIITVNYNGFEVTAELLNSLKNLTYPNFEILIVDNASKVNSSQALKGILPKTQIIVSEINLGFAGGNNLGIKHATGEYLFFVNNDTELSSDIIEKLINTFSDLPKAGIISPKFHYFFHKGVIEYAGYGKMNFLTARNKMIGNKENDQGQYNKLTETNYAHGGAMMVPRKIIDEVGGIPECYFLYYEEMDWCEIIKQHGYKIYYQPNALIYHKESATTGKDSPLKTYYLTRNRILFMRRNASKVQLVFFFLYFLCFTFPKNFISYLLKKEPKHLSAFIEGIKWHLTSKRSLVYTGK